MKANRIWVFSCWNESGDRWIEGFFTEKLNEEQQHGYFKDHYEYAIEDYCDEFNEKPRCYMYWELVELDLQATPEGLPREKWSESF